MELRTCAEVGRDDEDKDLGVMGGRPGSFDGKIISNGVFELLLLLLLLLLLFVFIMNGGEGFELLSLEIQIEDMPTLTLDN
jgi:hypothetical protein